MLYRLDPNKPEDRNLTPVTAQEIGFDPARRRVIMFPGGGAYFAYINPVGNYRHVIAGSLRSAEQAVSPYPTHNEPPVDVYLYMYERNKLTVPEPLSWLSLHAAQQDALKPGFKKDFGQDVFLKLILKPDESLDKLSKDEIKTRVSHLTFIGHSLGSVIVQLGSDYLVKQLRETKKFSEADIKEITHELVTVSVASVARQDVKQPTATQFFFTADNDQVARKGVERFGKDEADKIERLRICGYAPLEEKDRSKLRAVEGAENRYAVRTTVPDTVTWQEKKNGGTITRTIPNKEQNFSGLNAVQHDFRAFLYGVPEVRNHLRNILLNAVQREPNIGNGHELAKMHKLNRDPATLGRGDQSPD